MHGQMRYLMQEHSLEKNLLVCDQDTSEGMGDHLRKKIALHWFQACATFLLGNCCSVLCPNSFCLKVLSHALF